VDIIFPTNFLAQVAEIIPYPRNAREHSETQISQIVASIREFGFTNPILVDASNVLIAGHGRLVAAQHLGMRQVPAIRLTGLTDAQIAALRIADNKLALNATWDDELLRTELSDLRAVDFDLGLTGFGEMELGQLFAPETDVDSEWQGMPEFQQADKTAWQSVTIHFANQEAVDAFAALIGQTITRKTRFTWFPQVKEDAYIDKRYAADDAKVSDLHSLKGAF